ncbi:caspase domain-containing protein [Streptomyces sp. NPDC086766]|uniref:caspase family protein n=1 Tax=Streptomyces sp. NPDC086766 TaxID=3365754 RepID=UPI003829B41C
MSALPDPGASRAVLVGTSRYHHLEQLPAVANNLHALAALLRGPLLLQLPDQHVTVLEEPETAHAVVGAVRRAAGEATDTLILYFAGHGLVDDQDELSLGLPQSEAGCIETALPYNWLRQALLRDSRAERHVVILDCCYSGRALGRMSGETGLADHAVVEGSFLLAAAAETRTASAPVGSTYTAFTGALLETLREGIPGGPALLELGAVYRHLRVTLEARGRPVPQARDRNSGAGLALGRNHAYLPAVPAAAAAPRDVGGGAGERLWPDPGAIRTGTGFVTALAQVRVVSGLTQQAVSVRSGGRISASTVSRLLNRDTLPARWQTTGVYLATCGVPDEQVTRWRAVWERLRTETASAEPAVGRPVRAEPGKRTLRERAFPLARRGRGH